jgi:hypothetical protein
LGKSDLTSLTIDGLLLPDKAESDAVPAAARTLLAGLQAMQL